MDFTQAQNYLLSLENLPRQEYMGGQHAGIFLKRLQVLLDILGNPEKKIPHYIHVTGTSGKGSVCLFLNSILLASGRKTGISTSPHIHCITERFTINGKPISKKQFTKLVEFIKPKLDECARITRYGIPSYFEVLEAMTLLHFAQEKVEWAIMEVGCGGRYDSSNIIPHKDIAIITNIGLDHVGIIGNNRKEIAYEKAGIIKRGALVFTQEHNKKMVDIIKKECKKNAVPLCCLRPTSYVLRPDIGHKTYDVGKTKFNYQNNEYTLHCFGNHQIKNATLAINVACALKIPESAIKRGLAKTKLPLRMEIVSKNPLIILDGAHNPDKMRTTVKTIDEVCKFASLQVNKYPNDNGLAHLYTCTPVHLIIGFSADKNINQMIKQLATLKPKTIAVTRNTTNPFRKVADPQLTSKQFKKLLPNTEIKIFLDPQTASKWSKSKTKTGDILLATGSIFLGGEIGKLV